MWKQNKYKKNLLPKLRHIEKDIDDDRYSLSYFSNFLIALHNFLDAALQETIENKTIYLTYEMHGCVNMD